MLWEKLKTKTRTFRDQARYYYKTLTILFQNGLIVFQSINFIRYGTRRSVGWLFCSRKSNNPRSCLLRRDNTETDQLTGRFRSADVYSIHHRRSVDHSIDFVWRICREYDTVCSGRCLNNHRARYGPATRCRCWKNIKDPPKHCECHEFSWKQCALFVYYWTLLHK